MKTVKAYIERGNDGRFSVYVDLKNKTLNYGIHGTGETVGKAIEDFLSSYEAMKEFYHDNDRKFVEAKFNFQYDMASFLQFYSNRFTLAGLQEITGINQGLLSHYINGIKHPRKQTVEKMERSIHSFAKELGQVRFM